MNGQTWLVAKNTYRNKVKSFGFWAIVLSPFLVAAIYLIIGLVVNSGFNQTGKLAVVNNAQIATVLKADKSLNTSISEVSSLEVAKTELTDGKVDGYLTEDSGKFTLVTTNKTSSKFNQTSFQAALTQLKMQVTAATLGLSSSDLQKLMTPASLTMKTQSQNGTGSGGDAKIGANMGIATVISVLIFMLLMIYAGMVAQEIGNEKSNRIMETLLAVTSSKVQYYGKILGVILLTMTQLSFYAIGFAIAYPFIKDLDAVKSMTGLISGIDLGFGIYVFLMSFFGILGYLFLASIIASLVNEQAQVQQAVQPLTFFSMIGYIGGIAGAAVPGNVVLRVLSFIPFISPTLMSSRYAIQFSSATEAYIALGLQIIATLAVAKLGERIYARNVLSYSSEKIFTQLIKNITGRETSSNQAGKSKSFLMRPAYSLRGKEVPVWRVLFVILVIIIIAIFNFLRR
ncbi:MAG: ABC transporter permease [Streptococcaceae bacterium]|jgi:ABC-2 type transport system permease protein|nr:ABC transporter permease [Streptococcaceae bacterium]